MIRLDDLSCAVAPPGYLLVERAEQPLRRGRIQIPDTYRGRTRSVEAIITSIGSGVQGFELGERVLLAHASGDEIRFEQRSVGRREERSLWKIPRSVILARVYGEDEVSHEGMHPDVGVGDLVPDYDDPAWEEGDSRGLL